MNLKLIFFFVTASLSFQGFSAPAFAQSDTTTIIENNEAREVKAEDTDPDPLPGDFVVGEEPKPLNMEIVKKLIGYPPQAKADSIEGRVVVRLLVDKEGNYVKHIVMKSAHSILTEAVTSKIAYLTFSPGRVNGKAVKVWVTIPFEFRL